MSSSQLPVLGYWDIRGRGECIRYLLAHAGVKYVDNRYSLDAHDEWFKKDKFNLGLDFPNLPYYLDGDLKLTQSLAIMRYLGRKYDLIGHNDEENTRIDVFEQQIADARNSLRTLVATKKENYEDAKKSYLESLPATLKLFSEYLGANRDFVVGKRVTYVDFYAYEVLDAIRDFAPTCFAEYPVLVDYLTRIEKLPAVKKQQSSKHFSKYKRFTPFVRWEPAERAAASKAAAK